jgi:hypothetical protein
MNSKTIPHPGQRIELVRMAADPNPVPPGTLGTVLKVDKWGCRPGAYNVQVAWDNGRTLALLTECDEWVVREG